MNNNEKPVSCSRSCHVWTWIGDKSKPDSLHHNYWCDCGVWGWDEYLAHKVEVDDEIHA